MLLDLRVMVRTVLLGMVDNTRLIHLNLRRHSTVRTEPYAVKTAVKGPPAARRRQSVRVRHAILARQLVLARRAALACGQDAVVVEPYVVFTAVKGSLRQVGVRSSAPATAGCPSTRPRYDSPSYLDPSRKRK